MRVSRLFAYLLVALALVGGWVPSAHAANEGWAWVRVTRSYNAEPRLWNVEKGVAVVNISGSKFSAELSIEDPKSLVKIQCCQHLLEGTIANGNIMANETVLNSDGGAMPFSGLIKRLRPEAEEQIVLTNPAGIYIELRRKVPDPTR